MGKRSAGGGRRTVSARRLSETEQDSYINPRLAQETPEQRMEMRRLVAQISNLRDEKVSTLREYWIMDIARQGRAEGRQVQNLTKRQLIGELIANQHGVEKARAAFKFDKNYR